VQAPLGISEMQLARKSPAQGEVRYYGQGRGDSYALPIEVQDAHGGWIAPPADLVRFRPGSFFRGAQGDVPTLLKPETLRQMTRASGANPHCACGWSISPGGDYSISAASMAPPAS
jgi:hypothetical protein